LSPGWQGPSRTFQGDCHACSFLPCPAADRLGPGRLAGHDPGSSLRQCRKSAQCLLGGVFPGGRVASLALGVSGPVSGGRGARLRRAVERRGQRLVPVTRLLAAGTGLWRAVVRWPSVRRSPIARPSSAGLVGGLRDGERARHPGDFQRRLLLLLRALRRADPCRPGRAAGDLLPALPVDPGPVRELRRRALRGAASRVPRRGSQDRAMSESAERDARHRARMQRKQAVIAEKVAAAQDEYGLLLVHTGNGKGKSSSAFGMVARAMGHGFRVGVVQFIKGAASTGEEVFFRRFPEQVRYHVMGEGFTWDTQDRQRDIAKAREAWAVARHLLDDEGIALVVLDELNIALKYGYLELDE